MRIAISLSFIALLPGLSIPAECSQLTYASQAAFDAAAAPLTNISFNSIPLPGGITTLSSYSADGVVFSGQTLSGPGIYAIGPSYYFEYDRDGNVSLDSYTGTSNNTMTISLPANTYAVGFDLFTVINNQPTAADTEDVVVGGQSYNVASLPYNGQRNGSDLAFFGVVSTTPIATVTLSPEIYSQTGTDIENFQFGGQAPASAPEPGSMFLLSGGALAALICKRARP
jgi:hypothetical protein